VSRLRGVALAAAGALAARAALAVARPRARGRPAWTRTNYRGRVVDLAGGPALAVAAATSSALGAPAPAVAAASLTAGLGAGGVGLYDDLVGDRLEQRAKGFRGHLAALRRGQVTSGLVKIAGIGAAGLAASLALSLDSDRSWAVATTCRTALHPPARWPTPRGSIIHTLLGAGVIAGSANLFNLLDLRPGRALKAGLLVGVPLVAGGGEATRLAAGPVGAAAAALPEDLGEQTMLGDCGANALGALLGTALAARSGPAGRAAALCVIAGLTIASERISFTQVIAGNPVLRRVDELGRHPRDG
jgi:UDP-N-acetylmuramyl pentapeptide phosphotransferase/UDP-N-acetylglucosamine-1-phosphate transferase